MNFRTNFVVSVLLAVALRLPALTRRPIHADAESGSVTVLFVKWFLSFAFNGHEWLARQLDKRRIGYQRYQNTFLQIDDLKTARKLCRGFVRRQWARVFDALARRVNPILPLIEKHNFDSYYWVIDACEVATDLMWRDRPRSLLRILDELFQHALTCFSADTLVRFLGHKPETSGDTEDDMEVRHREQMSELSFRPQCLIEPPTPRPRGFVSRSPYLIPTGSGTTRCPRSWHRSDTDHPETLRNLSRSTGSS